VILISDKSLIMMSIFISHYLLVIRLKFIVSVSLGVTVGQLVLLSENS